MVSQVQAVKNRRTTRRSFCDAEWAPRATLPHATTNAGRRKRLFNAGTEFWKTVRFALMSVRRTVCLCVIFVVIFVIVRTAIEPTTAAWTLLSG
jgi:hypothetical protein